MRERMRRVWSGGARLEAEAAKRKTELLPSVLTPYGGMVRPGGEVMPKPTPGNLRRFAEVPAARRAINCIKDRIASMDWQVRLKRGYCAAGVEDAAAKMHALRMCLEEPNGSDSFRTLAEQVLEDLLVGGFGAIEMEAPGEDGRPFQLWPVDGATIQVNVKWDGSAESPRYAQATGRPGKEGLRCVGGTAGLARGRRRTWCCVRRCGGFRYRERRRARSTLCVRTTARRRRGTRGFRRWWRWICR